VENMVKKGQNFWEGKKVLVTGATGLVGSWLIKDLLKLKADIVAFVIDMDPQSELLRSGDIKKISVINGRLENFFDVERAVNEHAIDTVFHLGAQTIVETAHRFPLATFESNIRGTYNLLEACRLHKDLVKRIVVASSDKAYGAQENLPYTEDMPLMGRYPYEVSKSCTDLISQSYFHSFELPVAVLRCGNIYGGGDLNWSRIIPGTIRSFLQKERPIIRSDGKFVRDYVYVKDVSQTYLHVAQKVGSKKVSGEAFNFSVGDPLKVIDLVKVIQKLMKSENLKPKILNSAKGEIHSQYLCSDKIRKMTKWEPQFDLKQGLMETIRWYREFFKR